MLENTTKEKMGDVFKKNYALYMFLTQKENN